MYRTFIAGSRPFGYRVLGTHIALPSTISFGIPTPSSQSSPLVYPESRVVIEVSYNTTRRRLKRPGDHNRLRTRADHRLRLISSVWLRRLRGFSFRPSVVSGIPQGVDGAFGPGSNLKRSGRSSQLFTESSAILVGNTRLSDGAACTCGSTGFLKPELV
jgi:hypothetical protein